MNLLLASSVYLAFHFISYALILRRLDAFRTERGIFQLHAFSYLYWVGFIACAGYALALPEATAAILFAAGLHGIYSISFLELWSLSQGSYSVAILAAIARRGGRATEVELAETRQIGAVKQELRLEALRQLKLLRPSDELSVPGRFAAFGLSAILWVSNGKITN